MRFMTKKEVADLLRVGEWTVDRWVKDRKLVAIKPAGKLLFERSEVEAFITSGRTGGRFE